MKFVYPSLLTALVLVGLPISSKCDRNTTGKVRSRKLDDEIKKTENVPHIGCQLLLKDNHDPQPKLVGKDFEMITTTGYKVENEVGATAAQCVGGQAGGYPCSNVDLQSMLSNSELTGQIGGGSQAANDIWGWTDSSSQREFAIIGMQRGTVFVEITNDANPVVIGGLRTEASGSSWRDIKTIGDYALIVSEESGHGMQVFDLKELLTATPGTTFSKTAHYTRFGSAHNIFVNEDSGYAYVVGARGSIGCSGGLHMINMSNPANPTFAGCYSADGYTHDVQCVSYAGPDSTYTGQEICFASNEDTVTIVDVTNKSSPTLISKTSYNHAYTHQGWLTENHEYFIFNDELDEARSSSLKTATHLVDVRNLSSPVYKGAHEGRTRAIDHNLYVKGDYVYQANYRAGLNILQIKDLSSTDFDEVGYFDIYPSSDSNSFNGAWSNYPYFNSGSIVVSGIEQGLFVLKFNEGGDGTPAPTESPTPAPPCEDDPEGWYDSDGPTYDCAWYAQGSNCESYGDNYENFGKTANEACCACGGGKTPNDEPTASPTASPSASPTASPTEFPTEADDDNTSGCPVGQALLEVEVRTDDNGADQNKFVVKSKNANGKLRDVVWREEDFDNNNVETFEMCLPTDKCYKFFMWDSARDGMCCEAGQGGYTVTWDGSLLKNTNFRKGRRNGTPLFGTC